MISDSTLIIDEAAVLAAIWIILVGAGLQPLIAAAGRLLLNGRWAVTKIAVVEVIGILRSELVKWFLVVAAALFGLGFTAVCAKPADADADSSTQVAVIDAVADQL